MNKNQEIHCKGTRCQTCKLKHALQVKQTGTESQKHIVKWRHQVGI